MSSILQPEEQVLSTLKRDGSRRWLKPKLSHGKWLARRRALAYVLIVIFPVIPFIKVGGRPLVLLDIAARRFTILGFTFLPTDTVLLAIFMVGLLLTVFSLLHRCRSFESMGAAIAVQASRAVFDYGRRDVCNDG